ncbi:hypothetical protein ACFRI7_02575 [Streptomyces sp. NPDC056716]|uniref:hypothetical protein n=1 Tax=unclassified Streptomyces TaxID=2593676 RepID=UPI003677F0A2
MSDGTYSADPARIRAGAKLIDSITAEAARIAAAFQSEVNGLRDWPGEGDSFAEQVTPQAEQERIGSIETIVAIAQGLRGVADGTYGNLVNITSTQGGAIEGISAESAKNPHV